MQVTIEQSLKALTKMGTRQTVHDSWQIIKQPGRISTQLEKRTY